MLILLPILILVAICLVIVITNCLFWPRVQTTTTEYIGIVSVLIPARNEEQNIAACLERVVAQGAVVGEILVYDDFSSDNTCQIIQSYTARYSQIATVDAVVLPVDWCGKNFACARLARAAQCEWLLFLDADSRLAPDAINRIVTEAKARQVTFLSCWPKFEMQTSAEKILMPFLNFVVFSIYPSVLSLLKWPGLQFDPKLGLAHGACMLFERESYVSFGGHEQVKDQIFEDTRIAQLWRASRRKGVCLDGQHIISLRMYSSFKEIWLGFQKNFFPGFAKEYNFWIFLGGHFIGFLLPFFIILVYPAPLIIWCCVMVLLIRAILLLQFKQSALSLVFHPLGELVLILLGLSSWWRCKTGRGVIWKGREYQKSV